jgi:hypothetical protein
MAQILADRKAWYDELKELTKWVLVLKVILAET